MKKKSDKKISSDGTKYSNTISNNIYILKLLLKACPGRVFSTILQVFINYFSWVFYSIIFMKYILNSFNSNKSFGEISLFVIFSMVLFCIFELFMSWFNERYRPLSDQIIYYKINKLIFDKATVVDISCYENPDFYNNYTRAISEANGRAISVLDSIAGLIATILSSLFVVYTMFTLDKFIALFTLLPVVGSFIFGKYINKVNYQHNTDDVPHNRKRDYVNRAVFLQKFAKELRLSKIFNVLKSTYITGFEGILKNVDKYKKKTFHLQFWREFIIYPVVFEGVWIYAAYRALIIKDLSLANCVVLSNAMVIATNVLLRVMENVVKVFENSLYIKNLRLFLDYKEKISEDQDGYIIEKAIDTLEFRNVTFTYDGQKTPILKNLNFKIHSNEKIALVGHNGAGKTTLVKLIMRLYDVTEGEILLNGINIKEYNLKAYRKLFGTVFQDFQIMSMSVIENVAMSDIWDEAHREVCIDALKKSGVYKKVSSLSKGVDTILTREFDDDGAVLSGGEFQKIAISRVFAKESSVIILDEPSSALDPIAEYRMYETLSKTYSAQEKIVVLISHRLSSAVLADTIYLLEEGEIVEYGTHEQLMLLCGKYNEMFMKQAKNYIEEEELEGAYI